MHGLGAWMLRHWGPIATLTWLASGALYLTLPPSPEQFNHAYMGWRLLEGDVPYRDFIDQNWPGVMALHALASWIFGINLWSWRAFDFLLFAVSALFLSDLVRLAAGRDAAKLGFVLFPLMYASVTQLMAGQHDMTAAQFLVGALWCHVRGYERSAWLWQLGTGLFLGAAMLNKPTVGVIGLLFPLHALMLRYSALGVAAQTAAAGAATLATLAVAMGAVLARGTSIAELVDAAYTFNVATRYADQISLVELTNRLAEIHYVFWPMQTVASVPAILWIFRRSNRSIAATALPLLWLAGALSFFLQARGFHYHLTPCFAALAGGFAISLMLVATGQVGTGGSAWKKTLSTSVVAFGLLWFPYKLAAAYRSLPPALLAGDYARHLSRFTGSDGLTVADVVGYVRRLDALPSRDCVLVVGTGSAINYLSKRRQPTRFYYIRVLIHIQPPLPLADQWFDLWEQELKTADCRFALVSRLMHSDWLPEPTRAAAALRGFLDRYQRSGVLGADGAMLIYERKKAPP